MIRSMTAFATREADHPFGRLTWEIRSVNQRYLDLSPRLPEELRVIEPAVREHLRQRLGRGKIEANLRFRANPGQAAGRLALNEDMARALLDCHQTLAGMAGTPAPPDLVALMRWPDLVMESGPDLEPLRAAALALLDLCVDALIEAREREGAELAAIIAARLDDLDAWSGKVRAMLPAVRAGLQTRFQQRLDSLTQPLEPGRLEQEIALQLQKLDVDEELERLDAHCREVRRVLGEEEPAGRRLDFLMQELNREANTLGSKSVDARASQAVVEMKVLIEQMREQVQNVE